LNRGFNEDPFVYMDESEENAAFKEVKDYFEMGVSKNISFNY